MKCLVAWILVGSHLLAGDWRPPEDPDPNKILAEAIADRREQRYEESLAKHVWFHEHAADPDNVLNGVRLTAGIKNWMKLAENYRPALTQFREVRDKTKERIFRERGIHARLADFQELVAMNEALEEPEQTVEAFQFLHKHNPDAATKIYRLAESALIAAKEYQLCGEYVTPGKQWIVIKSSFRSMREFLKKNPNVSVEKNVTQKFIHSSATLVALLVIIQRPEEAQEIAEEVRDHPIREAY